MEENQGFPSGMIRETIDLPDFYANTALAIAKMVGKAAEKGNTWRMEPDDPFLYNELDVHVEKLKQRAQALDLTGIVNASLDIINFANMIIDNAKRK